MVNHGSQDLDKLMEWCFDNSDKDIEEIQAIINQYIEAQLEVRAREPPAAKKTKPERQEKVEPSADKVPVAEPKKPVEYFNLFKSAIDSQLEGLMSKKLKEIWNQFLEKVESLEIKEYLSFQALAKCLERLSDEHGAEMERKVWGFNQGQPSLVVCPEAEMHAVALSFYMHDCDKQMPGLDEILICQRDTPLEQIELLCRRAFTDKSGKIYVIMHAEKMNYDSGMHIEQLVKQTTVSNHNYRLIFMASKERNEHSYIVTAYDKYRVQMTPVPQQNQIQNYILNHLRSNIRADPDGSRLRIVKSNESGNGKSLVVQRLSETIPDCQRNILQIHDNDVCFNKIISVWLKEFQRHNVDLFHLDITPTVHNGKDDLIFSLSVLGGLADSSGQIWICPEESFVVVEITSFFSKAPVKVNCFKIYVFRTFLCYINYICWIEDLK